MDEHSPGCWESIAGEPPVVGVHHEFARFEQLQTLQVTHGDEGAVLSKAVEDKLLAKSEREGLPHFTEIP